MESPKQRAQLGKYTLVAEMARGGMGIVYLAQVSGPAGFQKLVVVKHLKPELAEDEKFRGMFLDEARLAARLNHRNIVQTNEVGEDDGRYFMAMEYLEGRTLQSLRNRLKSRGAELLPAPLVLRIACEVLAALHYAHELADYDGTPLRIVHRDVSPQNVFLTYDGHVKLLDFGVAKARGHEQETQAGMLKGRVVCMSPEHVDNDDVDRRADIFSMGVMLREGLTGKRMWEGLAEMDVIKELIARRIPPFPEDERVPSDVRAIIEKAMAVDRKDRYATAHEMRVALETCVARLDPAGAHSLSKVGEILVKEFADHRDRVKAMIEQHIAASSSASASAEEFPNVSLPLLPLSSPDVSGGSSISSPSKAGSLSRTSSVTGGSVPKSIGSRGSSVVATEVPHESLAPPGHKRSPLPLFMGIGVVILAIAGAVILVKRDGGARDGAKASARDDISAATSSQPALVTTPTADVVELTVRASPATAQIFIDDAAVTDNPWHAKYPRGSSHTIRVVAPGHTPRAETVTLSEATNMSVSLDKQSPASVVAAAAVVTPRPTLPAARAPEKSADVPKTSSAAPSSPPPVAPTDISQGGGKAPKRTIDQKNPYQ